MKAQIARESKLENQKMSYAIKMHMNKVKLKDLQRKLGLTSKTKTSRAPEAEAVVSSSSAARCSLGTLPKSKLIASPDNATKSAVIEGSRSPKHLEFESVMLPMPEKGQVIEIDDDE